MKGVKQEEERSVTQSPTKMFWQDLFWQDSFLLFSSREGLFSHVMFLQRAARYNIIWIFSVWHRDSWYKPAVSVVFSVLGLFSPNLCPFLCAVYAPWIPPTAAFDSGWQILFGQWKVRLLLNAGLQNGANTPLLSPLIRARVGCILPFGYTIITLLWLHFESEGTGADNYIRHVCLFPDS